MESVSLAQFRVEFENARSRSILFQQSEPFGVGFIFSNVGVTNFRSFNRLPFSFFKSKSPYKSIYMSVGLMVSDSLQCK